MKRNAPLVGGPTTKVPWPPRADMAVGWVGAALLFPFEVLSLQPRSVGLIATVFALFAALGSLVGLAVAAANTAGARVGSTWLRACVRASPSLLVTIVVGLRLFDGAKASTLPAAACAPLWFPLLCWLGLAAAVGLAQAYVTTPRRRLAVALALLGMGVAFEWINRNVQRSGYFDVHTMLLVSTCVAMGLAVREFDAAFARPWSPPPSRLTLWAPAALVLILLGFVATLVLGLQAHASRWQVATQGLHTRLLVRAVHAGFDFDRDGHPNVLGGDDCDSFDALIHPGAPEKPHNGVDENCDGRDDDVAAAALAQQRLSQKTMAAAWRNSPEVQQQLAATATMNLILISIDALRADVVDASEASQKLYPNLSQMLREGLHFTRAFAPSAGTDLSMSGVLTGQIDPYATTKPTLAEALKRSGRRAYAVIPTEVTRYVGKPLLARGLDEYKELVGDLYERDVGSHSTSGRTTELGLGLLNTHQDKYKEKPFFLWLHYFDVHEHDELRATDKRVRAALQTGAPLSRPEKYRQLVTLVDEQIGVLLNEVTQRNLAHNTVIVVVSDHGEGLGEDRRLPQNHGRFVYNALVHVPLAIRIPGIATKTIDHPISLLDLYPTLNELLTGQSASVDGSSFLAHVLPGAPADLKAKTHPLPLNESDQFGVIAWPYKLLVRRRENLAELYNLQTDFAEARNLALQEPERAKAMLATYSALPSVDVNRTARGRLARNRTALRGAQPQQPKPEQR